MAGALRIPRRLVTLFPRCSVKGARSVTLLLVDRARRMLDWLVSIQMASGAFQGGTMGVIR